MTWDGLMWRPSFNTQLFTLGHIKYIFTRAGVDAELPLTAVSQGGAQPTKSEPGLQSSSPALWEASLL